ncbi:hypothetical protein DFH06DRAFT_702510 [Mycena polygramma]|nr:hypothetical protein DFH06DRAFT_702510 [Mycena polygramma]
MPTPPKATVSIEFVVVGGSITGLALGHCLSHAGHKVQILEKNEKDTTIVGSVRSPPNMTRILKGWPGAEDLFTNATKVSGMSFRRAQDSEPLGYMKFHAEIMSELEADFFVLPYDDLVRYLTQLCLDDGVVIKYGCEAVGISTADGTATVKLKDGSAVSGDVIIGADGHNSSVRRMMEEDEEAGEPQVTDNVTGINIAVPTKVFQEHEELKSLCHGNETTIWAGNGSSLIGTLDLDAETSYFSLCSLDPLDVNIREWSASSPDKKRLPFDLSGYDPRLQKLIDLGSGRFPTVQPVFELEDVVGFDSTTALVGDAAHCAPIHGTHNAAMGIEDAVVLGRLFSRLPDRSRIAKFLSGYHEVRQRRTRKTQKSEVTGFGHQCLPPGEAQVARDAVYRITLDPDFNEFTKCSESPVAAAAWEESLVMFSYNADDEADEWWTKWKHAFDEEAQKARLATQQSWNAMLVPALSM